jgi:DNA-binding transcriptional regulator of glucitol operon
MKRPNSLYKRSLKNTGAIFSGIAIIQLLFFGLEMMHFNRVIENTSVREGLSGAFYSFFAVFTVYFFTTFIREYFISTKDNIEDVIGQIEQKFMILTTELLKQKEELTDKLKHKDHNPALSEYLSQLENEEIFLQQNKMLELKRAMEKYKY